MVTHERIQPRKAACTNKQLRAVFGGDERNVTKRWNAPLGWLCCEPSPKWVNNQLGGFNCTLGDYSFCCDNVVDQPCEFITVNVSKTVFPVPDGPFIVKDTLDYV